MFAVTSLILVGASLAQGAAAGPQVSLAERAHEILVSRCIRCHGGVREQGGVNLAWPERATRVRARGQACVKREVLWKCRLCALHVAFVAQRTQSP